ncbi:MAG: WD40 repeat domain-containing protein [Gemmata sp.]
MRVLKTGQGKVLDLAVCPDSRAVAAALYDAGVLLWNLDSPTGTPVRLEDDMMNYFGGLGFSADGRRVFWTTKDGETAYDRDSRTTSHEPRAPGLLLSADRTKAVANVRYPAHTLSGWHLKEGEWIRQWQMSTRDQSAERVALAPAGDRFAVLTRPTDGPRWWQQPLRLEVRDAANANLLATGTYTYSYAANLHFHPGGEQVAGINGMTLLAWAVPAGGGPRLTRNDSRKHFTALAYHPDGRRLFVTSNDETVHVFDTVTLDRVGRYTWQLDKLNAVALSPDGTLAAAGSANGDVVVWDLD